MVTASGANYPTTVFGFPCFRNVSLLLNTYGVRISPLDHSLRERRGQLQLIAHQSPSPSCQHPSTVLVPMVYTPYQVLVVPKMPPLALVISYMVPNNNIFLCCTWYAKLTKNAPADCLVFGVAIQSRKVTRVRVYQVIVKYCSNKIKYHYSTLQ